MLRTHLVEFLLLRSSPSFLHLLNIFEHFHTSQTEDLPHGPAASASTQLLPPRGSPHSAVCLSVAALLPQCRRYAWAPSRLSFRAKGDNWLVASKAPSLFPPRPDPPLV